MYGSIIGDVAGSYLEFLEIEKLKEKEIRSYEERMKIMDESTPLFTENSSVTDDTILTAAVAYAVMHKKSYEETLKEFAKKELEKGPDMYGRSRFSPGFVEWVRGNKQGKSYGNGGAMRISPVGYLFDDLETVKTESKLATIPSHCDIDSLRCSEAVATCIFLIRKGYSKEEIKDYVEGKYFKLYFDMELLRHGYKFTSRAIWSVPQAIFCFLESNSFEDAIRKALSIGGDSDTIACITGALAESFYGVDENLRESVLKYIPNYIQSITDEFYENCKILKKEK